MPVSIRKAFSAVFSKRYSKKNILMYAVILALLDCCPYAAQAVMPYGSSLPLSSQFAAAVLLIIAVLIAILSIPVINGGLLSIFVNNELYRPAAAAPPLSKMPEVLLTGIKYSAGTFILFLPFIIAGIILALIMQPFLHSSANIPPFIQFVFVIALLSASVIYIFRICIPLCMIFMHTLKLGDFLRFSDAGAFLEKRKGHYLSYIVRVILAMIIFIAAVIIISIPIGLLFFLGAGALSVFFSGAGQTLNTPMPPALAVIMLLAGAIINIIIEYTGMLLSAVFANLTAQFIKSANRPAKPQVQQ